MGKKLLSLFLALTFLTGCAATEQKTAKKQYQATFLDLFDTVTTIVGYAETEEEFKNLTDALHDRLLEYHQLFDIYYDYEGINNVKTINDQAGISAVEVRPELLAFLKDCKEYYEWSGGRVNAAMGSVLKLWHEEREAGVNDPEHAKLPSKEALEEAAEHCSIDNLEIDEDAGTVYLSDPQQSLDVGAAAKGWAAQRVCENAPSGLLISVGGNVCATGPKPETDSPWVVGIQAPEGEKDSYLNTIYVEKECVVTSGDYQRYYTVDGKRYHHLIDPATLYPGELWSCVSVVCDDSGVADALSTALFLMDMDEGQRLLEQFDACAVWVDPKGEIFYSTGFEDIIKT